MPTSLGDLVYQEPLNTGGVGGQRAFVAKQTVIFSGGTGNVATNYGAIPQASFARTSTGIYTMRFPPVKAISFFPSVRTSTGQVGFSAQFNNVSGPSGSAEIVLSRAATNGDQPANPPTAMALDLLFFASPIQEY